MLQFFLRAGIRLFRSVSRRPARHHRALATAVGVTVLAVMVGACAGVAAGPSTSHDGFGVAAVDTAADVDVDVDAGPALPEATVSPTPARAEVAPTTTAPKPAPTPTPTPTPIPTPTPTPALSPAAAFEPHVDDVEREAKRLAGRFVQALTTYSPGATPSEVAAIAAAAHGGDPVALAEAAADLVHPDAQSVGSIVYPQLGGLTAERSSVMVVARQELMSADGTVRLETRTLDVRLHREDGSWRVDHLASDGGPVAERPADLPPEAVRVLDHPGIELPDTARWDIYRGAVDLELLDLIASVADRHEIGVVVLVTGHPWEVFGTDRMSQHTAGRAFDVYRVEDELVASGRHDGSPTQQLARWLFDAGTARLGSPWAFDGFGGRSFTDALHQDHVHIALYG
jgi:hypothetical protein